MWQRKLRPTRSPRLFQGSVSDHQMADRIAEPARAGLLPGFAEAKAAALEAGALGSSISGSGPTVFALARGRESAERIGRSMAEAYRSRGQSTDVLVGRVDQAGARVLEDTGEGR